MKPKILIIAMLCFAFTTASAQDLTTKGGVRGIVEDANQAAVPNAKITVVGPTGERTVNANEAGEFEVSNLTPGTYSVRAEQSGFKTISVPDVVVFVGKMSSLKLTLETGNISEVVEVTSSAAAIDQSSTAVGQNLNDQLFDNLPVQRSVTSLFYLSPGATDSLAGGRANPSISGGSALDNLYIADGVNITDSAFGGLGTFSRNFGSLGTGINTAYIKEVQVKTGGFEPQYGQSQGGIINIITKSGGNEYHGALYGYAQPKQFEAGRRQPDDTRTNKFGKLLHDENYDVGADVGGYVPGLRDKMFFFGSFNPTVRREVVRGAAGSGLERILGDYSRRYRTLNYAFKLDYNLNPSHQVNFSIFGDPTKSNLAPFSTLNIDNTTALSKLELGTRNTSLRYNGTLNPTWTVSASFSQSKNDFSESGFDDFNQITDRTQPARGNFRAIGYGFFEPTQSKTYRATFDTSKQVSLLGTHTVGLGYQYQRSFYAGTRDRSGPKYRVPATNADGTLRIPTTFAGQPLAGEPLNASFNLRLQSASCTLCPLVTLPDGSNVRVSLQQNRGEYGDTSFDTNGSYHAAYIQDAWRINRFVTAVVGLRHEQERINGNPLNGKRAGYSFTGQWAPRLGVTVNPLGRGKTKAYYNYGRYFEYLPLDAAERTLSQERDFYGGRFAPDFFIDATGQRRARINQFGTVTPVVDAAHLLTGAAGGIAGNPTISASDPFVVVAAGTKLGFTDEHVVGFEQQLPRNFVLSVRYLDRRLGRIIEDGGLPSPEAVLAGVGQTLFLANVSSRLDAGINLQPFRYADGAAAPAGCARDEDGELRFSTQVNDINGNSLGNVCFGPRGINADGGSINSPDGMGEGFPDPVRIYRALEIELNKRFSNNWQVLANWRIASLRGNYEGHLRNDNNQTDPGISSLFDFSSGDFNLLGDQYAIGPLNTDRRHIVNIYGSYAFSQTGFGRSLKGLNLGAGLHMESGVPTSEYLAHPAYQNAGEIPVGGRGKVGRTPFYSKLDLHADYTLPTSEKTRLVFVADFFNVMNSQKVRLFDQFRESQAGQLNPDFLQPAANNTNLRLGYHPPFNMRLGVRFEF